VNAYIPENSEGGGVEEVLLESDICEEVRNRLQGSTLSVVEDGERESVSSASSLHLLRKMMTSY
jgi:hypothetical protein